MFMRQESTENAVSQEGQLEMPTHVAIIMDGNGRWANQRRLPRNAGHKKGADTFSKIARHCRSLGIKYLTAYTFSTENWRRPQEEIDGIMALLRHYLEDTFRHQEEDARLCFLGDREPLAPDIREMIEKAERGSENNTAIRINIALNYGGRDEIVHAVQKLAAKCAEGTLEPQAINEQMISDHLYTAGQPDPDVIIRPSGEQRMSNFLPWQSAYSELVFLDVLWPDFTEADFDRAIAMYRGRSRRFGGV